MNFEPERRTGLIVGALIGAALGAMTAHLLMTAPANLKPGEKPKPLDAKDLMSLTTAVGMLIRKLDDVRRRT
jgi:hypothetical protein